MKTWTPAAKRLYARFPALVRSSKWDELAGQADGDMAGAVARAQELERRTPQYRAQNVFARRIRRERVVFFQERRRVLDLLKQVYARAARDVEERAAAWATPRDYKKLLAYLRARHTMIRADVRRITTDAIYASLKLGLRHTADAIQPVLDQNREEARQLAEERLHVGLSVDPNAQAQVKVGSTTWDTIIERSYELIALKSVAGLTPARRIWAASQRAELSMQSIIRTGLANGEGSDVVARRLKRFLDPDVLAGEENPGPGVYRNPFANAARLARTEMNKAYTLAQAEWAKTRSWVDGIMITLSPAHQVPDECDDYAGRVVSPDEFAAIVPIHPHCFCLGTPVVKDEYLDIQAAGDAAQNEEAKREAQV